MGKQTAGTAIAERQADGTPQGIAENSPIRQGASPSAHPVEDGISPPSKIVRFIVSQARKERNIWVS